MLHEMLSDAGYEVEVQSDGHAVQHMAEPFPDLLFLDIRLSGSDGLTICRQLKSQETTHRLPIIMLSAHKDTRQMAREAGADDFLANRSRWRTCWHWPQNMRGWARHGY
jgi:CheY-like chemotaxis protein